MSALIEAHKLTAVNQALILEAIKNIASKVDQMITLLQSVKHDTRLTRWTIGAVAAGVSLFCVGLDFALRVIFRKP